MPRTSTVGGQKKLEAHAVGIRARLGNVDLDANNFVRATGEKNPPELLIGMDIVNATGFSADLARAILPYRDLMLATVVVKCGFEVSPAGEVSAVADPMAVEEGDVVTPYGTNRRRRGARQAGLRFRGDGVRAPAPRRPRRDRARRPAPRRGSRAALARLRGPALEEDRGRLRGSPPEPFTEMILGYDKAYGGKAIWHRRQKAACYENPDGKGFVVREEDVDGLPLPNLEDADCLISSWQDRPTPAGLAPLPRLSSLRGARGYRVDLDAGTTAVEPLAFCFSHPGMMLPAYPAGAPFELIGMGFCERMAFTVPPIHLSVQLRLGAREHALPLVPDTLVVFPDHARFFVVARRAFVYQFIPERLRSITVRAAPPAAPAPDLTIRAARADASAGVPIEPADEELALAFDDVLRLSPMTEMVESLPLCPSG